jgi:hypothetical protein
MSKSPPVRIRSVVFSLTIGNGTFASGSESVIASRIFTSPFPLHSVFHLGRSLYRRRMKLRLLALEPKPLSGIA